jgi:hypothetical protein
LVGKSEGKRLLDRPRRISDDNIKVDLKEIRYENVDWIRLAQGQDSVECS